MIVILLNAVSFSQAYHMAVILYTLNMSTILLTSANKYCTVSKKSKKRKRIINWGE